MGETGGDRMKWIRERKRGEEGKGRNTGEEMD